MEVLSARTTDPRRILGRMISKVGKARGVQTNNI
jgi:hypothetical protein